MSQSSRAFRIFISSTFSDLKAERNALQKYVFPRLKELAATHDCRFQAIDLRWGVSREAALDQQTMKICLGEIERCHKVSLRPNFIILLGDRYGWHPLPYAIPEDELNKLLPFIPLDIQEKLLWQYEQPEEAKGWYRLDENAVPAEYVLQPRQHGTRYIDYTVWETEVERPVRKALVQAAFAAGLNESKLIKYSHSATAQEIVSGALQVKDACEHIFGFFRSITNLDEVKKSLSEDINRLESETKASNFIDTIEQKASDADAEARLIALKEQLKDRLPGNIHEYEAEWTGDGLTEKHIGILPDTLTACLTLNQSGRKPTNLCEAVWLRLSKVMLDEAGKLESVDILEREQHLHEDFMQDRARLFAGRKNALGCLMGYLENTSLYPLVIWGESGSGKSALIARAVQQYMTKATHSVIIFRSIGATSDSSNGRFLLENLCKQIARQYGSNEASIPHEYCNLLQELPKWLEMATEHQPLILFLDAIDQLSAADGANSLSWLPIQLPPYVRLVVSTLPGIELDMLTKRLPPSALLEVMAMNPEEGKGVLENMLSDAGRKLSELQSKDILHKFIKDGGLPLYLKLSFEEARRWHSYNGLLVAADGKLGLSEHITGIIHDFFRRLEHENSHGEMLVSHAIGYLAAARNGLSEDEMLDVLWADEDVCADFFRRSYKSAHNLQALPVVIWSRLYMDLEPYLAWRQADGAELLGFYHRQLKEIAAELYCSGNEKAARHRLLADYFQQIADPLGDHSFSYTNNQRRALEELPFHLYNVGDDKQEYENLLMELRYVDARCEYLSIYNLIDDCIRCSENEIIMELTQLLTKYAQKLSYYKNLFFSLVCMEQYKHLHNLENLLVENKDWKKPWLKMELMDELPLLINSNMSDRKCASLLNEYKYDISVMACSAESRSLAFRLVRIGRIDVIDTIRMMKFDTAITIPQGRPLSIYASPLADYLVIAYENGSAYILHLIYDGNERLVSQQRILNFHYYLPEVENPVMVWADTQLFYQEDKNSFKLLSVFNGQQHSNQRYIIDVDDCELSSAVQYNGDIFFSVRQKYETRLYSLSNAVTTDCGSFLSQVRCACSCKDNGCFVFNDNTAIIISPDGKMIAQIRTGRPWNCICSNGKQIYGIDSTFCVFEWNTSNDSILQLAKPGDILPSSFVSIPYRLQYRNGILECTSSTGIYLLSLSDHATEHEHRYLNVFASSINALCIISIKNELYVKNLFDDKSLRIGAFCNNYLAAVDGCGNVAVIMNQILYIYDMNHDSFTTFQLSIKATASITGDTKTGFWLATKDGAIARISDNRWFEVATLSHLGVSAPAIINSEGYVVWKATCLHTGNTLGTDTKTAFVFYRKANMNTLNHLGIIFYNSGAISAFAIQPSTNQLAIIISRNGEWYLEYGLPEEYLRNTQKQVLLHEIKIENENITAITFAENDNNLFLLSSGGMIFLWEEKEKRITVSLCGPAPFSHLSKSLGNSCSAYAVSGTTALYKCFVKGMMK